MAGEWPTVPLGSLAAEHDGAIAIGPFGSSMKANVYVPRGVPIIRGTNISSTRELIGEWVYIPETFADAMPRCVVRDGDLVFPHRGSIGEVALVPSDHERYFLSTSCMKITLDRNKADPRYVAYYFKSQAGRAEIMRFASQVGTPGIGQPLTSLRRFNLPAPPVCVQRAIADLLSSLDDKIELNRRLAQSLEAIARLLFKSWFIDFAPVHAKAEGRPTGLPDSLAVLFPDSFGQDGLPQGWTEGSIADLAMINPVTPLTAKSAPYIDMAALPTTGSQVTRVIVRAPGSGARFRNGDTVVARITPCLENGKTALIDCLDDNAVGWGSTEFIVLRPKSETPLAFPYLLARYQPFRDALIAAMSGTSGRQRVQADAVARWPLAIPTKPVLSAFSLMTSPLFSRITLLGRESSALAVLHYALLPKLISGELQIRDVEKRDSAA